MALRGTLHDFALSDIFQLIGVQRKTGVLSLRNGILRVRVCFLAGGVVSADTSDRPLEDRLGAVLVKSGKITERQLGEALNAQRVSLQRLGKVLIERRVISAEDLRTALESQVLQIVHHLFRWKEGEYDFSQEATIDYDRENFVPIPADSILMEGARMVDEWPIIERRIRDFRMVLRRRGNDPSSPHGPISVYETDFDFGLGESGAQPPEAARPALQPDEERIYRLVDGRVTVQDIIDSGQLGEFETCRILYDLIDQEMIEEGTGEGPAAEAAAAAPRRAFNRRAAVTLMILASLVSLALSWSSPLSPMGSRGRGSLGIDRIRVHLSQARLDRIDRALRVYQLERRAFPTSLDALVREGLLRNRDLVDPWGQGYRFALDGSGYEITGSSPPHLPQGAISIRNPFGGAPGLIYSAGGSPLDPRASAGP